MFEVGVCNLRYVLKILLIATGFFLLCSLLNIIALMGFFRFKYNTTYECFYDNISHCDNPENRLIGEWATGLSFVIVLVALALFIIYLTIQYIRKRRTTYEITTTEHAYDELEFEVGKGQGFDSDSETDVVSDAKKED